MSAPSARTRATAPWPSSSRGSTRSARPRTTANGRPAELALGELRGAGDLVGDGRRGHQRAGCRRRRCGRRRSPPPRRPAAPTAMSVWPSRQARPAVSVTTTPTTSPVSSCSRPPDPSGGGVRVERQQHHVPGGDVGGVDAGGGHGQAVPGAHDRGRPPARHHADGLVGDGLVAIARRGPGPRPWPTTLLVTTTTSPSARPSGPSRPTEQQGQVVALARPRVHRRARRPSRRHDDQGDRGGRHRGGRVEVGHQQRHGGAGEAGVGHAAYVRGVLLVDQPAVEDPAAVPGAVVQADRRGAHLDADGGEQLFGHAAEVVPADDGGEADDRGARRPDRLADAGHAQDRAHGDDRVARRDDDQVGVDDRVDHAGSGRGLLEADEHQRLGGDAGAQPDPVLLEVHHPTAARRVRVGHGDVRLDAVVGHGQQPDAAGSASAGTGPRSPRRAGSRRRASGCAPGGWRGRGRRGRTRWAPRRTPRARPWRARSRRVGPSRARGRCRRRGCT